jgi:MFS family permease
MTRVLYLIFFASGAAGLVYQVLWLRLTGLVFGNTSYSIAIVLGAFMAGLALGNWRLGIVSDRVARPLRMYGVLEVLIGISAYLVPVFFRAMDGVYWDFAPQLTAIPGADFFTRFAASFTIMLVPTFLMGGTLPVMARLFIHRIGEVESKLATLYALNTFGAAVGVLAAALFLVPVLGNHATTLSIAALNIALGLLAIGLDLRLDPVDASADERAESDDIASSKAANPVVDQFVLATLAISGFVALLYEVAWTRALSALISNSTYAFAIMLVTFLVGIALGSSWAARYRPAASLRMLGIFQLAIAAGGLIFLVGYLLAPTLLVSLVRALYYSFPAVPRSPNRQRLFDQYARRYRRFAQRRVSVDPADRYRENDSHRPPVQCRYRPGLAPPGPAALTIIAVRSGRRRGADRRVLSWRSILDSGCPGSRCADLRPPVRGTPAADDRRALQRDGRRLFRRRQERDRVRSTRQRVRRPPDQWQGRCVERQ